MLVPSCARAKAVEIMKTPNRSPDEAPSRKKPSSSKGFQIGLSYMMVEEEDTMIPMNDVQANPMGIVKSWSLC